MSTILKPLRFKDLKDLDTNMPNLKKFSIKSLLTKSDELYKEAERCASVGDQEMNYIMLHKYFNIVSFIRKSADFGTDPKYYSNMMGVSRAHDAINKLERLTHSLRDRYDQLNVVPTPDKLHASVRPDGPSPNSRRSANGLTHGDDVDDDDDDGDGDDDEAIDVNEFLSLLKNRQVGVLVMDCRPREEFAQSRISLLNCLNVPAEIVKPGLSAGKIQCELSPEGKTLWASRSIKDHVVLMDWNSTADKPDKTLDTLRTILLNWDPDCNYRNTVRVLSDGYELFMHTYPMYTTNAKYRPPSTLPAAPHTFLADAQQEVDNIEYPDISDIQMKDTIRTTNDHTVELGLRVPAIDRTSKVAALQLYESTVVAETLEAERSMVEALETARELSAVREHAETVPTTDEAQSQLIDSKRTELEYKLMQLDDQRASSDGLIKEIARNIDANTANGGLLRPIDEAGRSMLEETQRRMVEHERRIAMHEQERKRLEDQMEANIALEKLRKRQAMLQNVNVQPRAVPVIRQQPAFDRSSKPSSQQVFVEAVESEAEVVRNFQAEPGAEGHGLTGLKNLGNTCYMNSIMQCLSNTAMLRDFFVSDEGYRKQFKRTSKTQRQIADEVSAVMREIWLNKHRHISSNDLRRVVGQCKQIFRGMDQQDSHEFLTILMDWLHLDLQPSMDRMSIAPVKTPAEVAWQEFAKCKESYIMQLFYGQIKSTVKCAVCMSESATFEGFSNLSLELPEHSNRCDITECLEMYFFGENISGWNCPKCKQKRRAVKKLDISKLPPILVIHFKRFNVDLHSSSTTYKKKQNYVRFPLADFDMSKYIAPTERQSPRVKNTVFELYGVSNHYGTMDRGHYTAFCKSSVYGKWFKYDDHIVSPMDATDVPSSAAYILFYATSAQR